MSKVMSLFIVGMGYAKISKEMCLVQHVYNLFTVFMVKYYQLLVSTIN